MRTCHRVWPQRKSTAAYSSGGTAAVAGSNKRLIATVELASREARDPAVSARSVWRFRAFDNLFGTSDGMAGGIARSRVFNTHINFYPWARPNCSGGFWRRSPIGLAALIIGNPLFPVRRIPSGLRSRAKFFSEGLGTRSPAADLARVLVPGLRAWKN